MLVRRESNWASHTGGSVNGTTTLKTYFQFLLKLNMHLAQWPSNSTPRYTPNRNMYIRSPKDMFEKGQSSTIPNSQNRETTQIQSVEWTNCDIATLMQQVKSIQLCAKLLMDLTNIMLRNESKSQKKKFCWIPYVWSLKAGYTKLCSQKSG